jgi:pyruvate dehydrogenase (quinone)
MERCDTLLIIGSNFPYSQFLPEFGKARAIQIDIDGKFIGMRYPTEVNHPPRPDPPDTTQPRPHLAHPRRGLGQQVVVGHGTPSHGRSRPINPMRIVWELSQRIPDNAIVTADSGSAANWYARHLRMRGQMRGSLSGTLATIGPGVPYAIGAKLWPS